jgi:hypothetical protein
VFGIFMPANEPLHERALIAFAEGLARRGVTARIYDLNGGYQPCDVAVTFGIGKRRTPRGRNVGKILARHEKHKGPGCHLVIERGFIHRDRYFMIGWGGLNGRADYCNAHSPPNRWTNLDVKVAPWRTQGEHIVLCGQIPWDSAVEHSDHVQWCRQTAAELLRLTRRPVVFRPHPLQPEAVSMEGLDVAISTKPTLQDDLANAWAAVTYNSNAGVEASLAGVPAFAFDPGAMGYSILNKDLQAIENPAQPDRRQWLHDLAYTQWTCEEMSQGLPLVHLWEKRLPALKRLWLAGARIKRVFAGPSQVDRKLAA